MTASTLRHRGPPATGRPAGGADKRPGTPCRTALASDIVSVMSISPVPLGGPSLPQQRRIVTEIPGPASRALLERRQRSVARGLGHVLPVFVTAAGGGIILDADGNSLIDFGSGIAVTSVGNSAELVVEPGDGAGRPVHPHLLHGRAV